MTAPIDRLLDQVEWFALSEPSEASDIPYATHEGTLRIGDLEMKCYTLNTGVRIIDANDVARMFGCASLEEFQAALTGKDEWVADPSMKGRVVAD